MTVDENLEIPTLKVVQLGIGKHKVPAFEVCPAERGLALNERSPKDSAGDASLMYGQRSETRMPAT